MRTVSRVQDDRSVLRKHDGLLLEVGFTLIELMIVITIILILVGIAAANYRGQGDAATVGRRFMQRWLSA